MFLHSKFGVNECNLNNKRIIYEVVIFINYIFSNVFQSILENSISIIYVDNKSFDDINSTINGDVFQLFI